MKSVFVLFFLISFGCLAGEANLRTFRFVEAKSVREKAGLPPKLEMTLEIMCNEEFAHVVRYERVEPKTQKITIAVGALVAENLLSSCAGKTKTIHIDAGTTFSGREYEVSRIKR